MVGQKRHNQTLLTAPSRTVQFGSVRAGLRKLGVTVGGRKQAAYSAAHTPAFWHPKLNGAVNKRKLSTISQTTEKTRFITSSGHRVRFELRLTAGYSLVPTSDSNCGSRVLRWHLGLRLAYLFNKVERVCEMALANEISSISDIGGTRALYDRKCSSGPSPGILKEGRT